MPKNTCSVVYRLAFLSLPLVLLAIGCSPKKGPEQQKFAFWPPYPDEPRIQFLTSFSRSADVEPAKSKLDELVLGKEPPQVLDIVKPYGVAMWQGRIYVCDIRRSAVTILDLRKRQTLVMGRSAGDNLQTPTDIVIAADGTKYVADNARGMVSVYDANDRHVVNWGRPDLKPVGLAVHEDLLYVCDFKGQRVEVWDRKTGDVLRTIGGKGMEEGQFILPLGMTVDQQGNLYVSDVMKCQIQKFDPQGKFVSVFGTNSANAGGLVRPKQIDVDKNGMIYVVDAAFQNVQLFDTMGRVYTYFGSAGSHPGAMYLPVGICVHDGDLDLFKAYIHPDFEAERLILVTNQEGANKVSVYALGHLKAGKTVADIAGSSRDVVPAGVVDPRKAATRPTTLPAEPGSAPIAPATQPSTLGPEPQ